MPRSRMVKPEFFDDEKLSEISRDARLLFIGLWVNSDDYGVVKGNHKWLKSKIYPYDEISPHQFTKWIKELEAQDCIRAFKTKGENYYWIRTFTVHQTINRPSATRNVSPPASLMEPSVSPHGVLMSETETEVNTETETKNLVRLKSDGDNGFDSFWKAYPKKIAKQEALKAYKKAKKKPTVERLLESLRRQIDSPKWQEEDGKYIPHPATWLNQGRWDDEVLTTSPSTGPQPRRPCPCGSGMWEDKCTCKGGLNDTTRL